MLPQANDCAILTTAISAIIVTISIFLVLNFWKFASDMLPKFCTQVRQEIHYSIIPEFSINLHYINVYVRNSTN